MKYIYLFLVSLAVFSCKQKISNKESITKEQPEQLVRVSQNIIFKAKDFLSNQSDFNNSIVFLIDFSYKSNKARFIVYDLENEKVLERGLVAHGSCEHAPKGTKYSNVPNSYCSSLGKYKVDYSYNGQYGLAYKLRGLETSNSNAYERFVVLHAHDCVPDNESNYLICESWGCPTVSPNFLQKLKTYIDNSEQPILLWLYDNKY